MNRTLTDGDIAAIEAAIRRAIAAELPRASAPAELRPVYTVEQFAAEILCGERSAEWVCDQCRAKKIKTVARFGRRGSWLIPMVEAARFLGTKQSL